MESWLALDSPHLIYFRYNGTPFGKNGNGLSKPGAKEGPIGVINEELPQQQASLENRLKRIEEILYGELGFSKQ